MARAPFEAECSSCGKTKTITPPARGGRTPTRCDDCRRVADRSTECEVCNVELPPHTGPGRPRVTCGPVCAEKRRNALDRSPERMAKRWGREVRRARRKAGRPEILDCKVCGEPVDPGVLGPKGYLEEGYDFHQSLGTDLTGEFASCYDRAKHFAEKRIKTRRG